MIEVLDPAAGEMQDCDFIGSGVLMFPTDVLLSLKQPWFFETVDPSNMQRLANMDCTFVWRLKAEVHCQVYVDTTIKVKHAHVFNVDETYQHRFEDWKANGVGDPNICRYAPIYQPTLDENRNLQGDPYNASMEMLRTEPCTAGTN